MPELADFVLAQTAFTDTLFDAERLVFGRVRVDVAHLPSPLEHGVVKDDGRVCLRFGTATHFAKAAADVQTRDIGDREMTNAGLVDATIEPATSEAVSALDIHFVAEAVLRDGALDVADLR